MNVFKPGHNLPKQTEDQRPAGVEVPNDYLTSIYRKMAVELKPNEDYFVSDSRFLALDEILSALPAGRVCDMGCGCGTVLKRLRDKHEVYGTEYDSGLVNQCQMEGLNVVQADLNMADSLPFDPGSFDAVLISEVCEHLLNPRNAIRLARRYLRRGGILVVTVPNAVPLFVRVQVLFGCSVDWLHYPSPDTELTGHLRFYTIESMSRLLREEQFDMAEARGVSFRFNGRVWGRFCYWAGRLVLRRSAAGPTRIDAWLGKKLPSLSPGLLFIAKSPSGRSEPL